MWRKGIFLLAVFWSAFCLADESDSIDEESFIDVAKQFSVCAAAFDVLAMVNTAGDEEAYKTHKAHELGNGAILSAKHIFALSGYEEGYAQAIYDTNISHWTTAFNGPTDKALANLKETIELCSSKEISGLQAQIVDDVRREMYKKK